MVCAPVQLYGHKFLRHRITRLSSSVPNFQSHLQYDCTNFWRYNHYRSAQEESYTQETKYHAFRIKTTGVIPSTCFMTKHDKECADRYPRILMHLPSFNDKQSWWEVDGKGSETWNGQHNGRVSWAFHKELWWWEGNNDILHQTTATFAKLKTQRPQSLRSMGLNIDRQEQWLLSKHKRHRKVSQRICPIKIKKNKPP